MQVLANLIHLKRWVQAVAELVMARRWIETTAGWDIHDYLEYQPSRKQVLAERDEKHAAKVAAGRGGGLAKAVAKIQANA